MAPAVITKSVKQELIAEIVPLITRKVTADMQKTRKRTAPASAPKEKSEFSRDIPIELLQRMVRVEEGLKSVNVEIKNLREDFTTRSEQMERMFDKRFEQVDKRFEQMERMFDKRLASMQWSMGIMFTVVMVLITVYRFIAVG